MAFKDPEKAKAYSKAWNIANREKLRAYNRARYLATQEETKARVRAYAVANKQLISERNKTYREANSEKMQAKSKAYYEAHRKERIAYQKALHAAKADVVKAYKKEWWAKNREQFSAERKRPENQAKRRAVNKKWYDATYHTKHREKFLARNAKRRALKVQTKIEDIDFKKILKRANGLCGICHKPFDLFGIDFDHIVPLSRGGAHVEANLQATHSSCNRSKGARVG